LIRFALSFSEETRQAEKGTFMYFITNSQNVCQ
jgi:hypothetical protein